MSCCIRIYYVYADILIYGSGLARYYIHCCYHIYYIIVEIYVTSVDIRIYIYGLLWYM